MLASHGLASSLMPENPAILAADLPLIVPMQLKISLLRLRAIAVLIVSRTKGVTLSFKTDPLESVLVSSTFDAVPSVRRHLQTEIETRLRDLLREELPAMVHHLSTERIRRDGPFSAEPAGTAEMPVFRPLRKTGSPFSLHDVPKSISPWMGASRRATSPSIAAQSAPPNLGETMAVGLDDFVSERGGVVGLERDFMGGQHLVGEQLTGGQHLTVTGHYFRKRSIIVRALTSRALPDPVLLDGSRVFRHRISNLSRMFTSLFGVWELAGETESPARPGLRAIDTVGQSDFDHGVADDGADGAVSMLPRAFSAVSGRRHRRNERIAEGDPDLVQFEPDEFRSDWNEASVVRPTVAIVVRRPAAIVATLAGRADGTRLLQLRLGIMRRLQSTIAPNTFVESNVLYRSMSGRPGSSHAHMTE